MTGHGQCLYNDVSSVNSDELSEILGEHAINVSSCVCEVDAVFVGT